MSFSSDRRLFCLAASALVFLFAVSGCSSGRSTVRSSVDSTKSTVGPPRLTVGELLELDQFTTLLADEIAMHLYETTEGLLEKDLNRSERRLILYLRFAQTTSLYGLATEPSPLSQLLDIVVQRELLYLRFVTEGAAAESLGDNAESLIRHYRYARDKAWALAEDWLTEPQLAELRSMIIAWRRANPDDQMLFLVRFAEFAGVRAGLEGMVDERRGGLFAELESTRMAIDESRMLAEGMFLYMKRLPQMVHLRAQALMAEALDRPEVAEALTGVAQIGASVSHLTNELACLEQRVERVAVEVVSSPQVADAFHQVREANTNLNRLVESTTNLKEAVDELSITVRSMLETYSPENIDSLTTTGGRRVAGIAAAEARGLIGWVTLCVAGLIAGFRDEACAADSFTPFDTRANPLNPD